MPNREIRRKIDLDARRSERKREFVEAQFLGKTWQFPAKPSLRAIEAQENGRIIEMLHILLGDEKASELVRDPSDPDIDDLQFLLARVYPEDEDAETALGESEASPSS